MRRALHTCVTLARQNAASLASMALLAAMPLAGSSGAAFLLYRNAHALQELGAAGTALFFAVAALTTALALTPATFVALASGFLLGWPVFPGVVVSYAAAALLGRAVARAVDRGRLVGFLERFPRGAAVMDELRRQSWGIVILTRLSPALPFALMTFVLSVMRVDLRRFLLGSLLGMLPRTLFFFWVGTQGTTLVALLEDTGQATGGRWLVLVTAVLSVSGLFFLAERALRNALRRSLPARG